MLPQLASLPEAPQQAFLPPLPQMELEGLWV